MWLQKQLNSVYDMKSSIMGSDVKDVKQQKILNRIVTWRSDCIEYEADPRHAEIIIKISHDDKISKVPGSKCDNDRELSPELSPQESTQYRAAAARCNFLAIDRPDIQYASKEASKYMSNPRQCDWDLIIKIARYLKFRPRLKHVFSLNHDMEFVDACVDSDWAGDKISRKSTTGAILKVGGHAVKTYSRNQKTIALSSGEAELYAIVSGIAEAIGVQSICADYGFNCKIRCFSDSSAAVGIVKRDGIGKVRHLQTQFLWVQEMTNNGKATIHKVGTNSNPADLLTKYLDSNTIEQHLQRIHLHSSLHRPSQAPLLVNYMHANTPYAHWAVGHQYIPYLCNTIYNINRGWAPRARQHAECSAWGRGGVVRRRIRGVRGYQTRA